MSASSVSTLSPSPALRWLKTLLALLPLLLVTVTTFWWMLSRLDVFEFGTDEGPYLMWTRLVRLGYPLYTQVWSDHPPLIVWSLTGLFNVFGESIIAARVLFVIVSVAGLFAVGALAWRAAGWVAGVAASVFLALSPLFNWYGRAVMPDTPANALAALSILAGLGVGRYGLALAALSGALFGASLMVKLVTLPLAPVALAALLVGQPGWQRALRAVVVWGVMVLLVAAACFITVEQSEAARLIVTTIQEAREAKPWIWEENWEIIRDYLVEGQLGVTVLALIGLAACLVRRSGPRLVLALWGGLGLVAVSIHSPLYDHHLALALFPCACLAGVAVADGLHSRWTALATAAAFVVYLSGWPMIMQGLERTGASREGENWQMLEDVQAVSDPGDWIITDNVVLAFRADLRVPPYIAYPGAKRLTAGLLPDEVWIQQTAHWQPRVILFVRTAGQSSRAAYLEWVDHTYDLYREYAPTRRVWLRPDDPTIVLTHVDMQPGVEFEGYSLESEEVAAGDEVHLGLFFDTTQPLADNYLVVAHMLTPDGKVVVMDEGTLENPSAEKWRYARGNWTLETRTIAIPDNLPPGDYRLKVGLAHLNGQPVGAPILLETPITVE